MSEQEWITVARTTTNTIEGSTVTVFINTTPICPNMTNAQFRKLMMRLRDIAVKMIDDRIIALATVWVREKERVQTWFGKSDEGTRKTLLEGLPRLQSVLRELTPENMIRYDDELGKSLSCVPVADMGSNDAAVCKPDSQKRIIQFYSHFCTLPSADLHTNCKLKVLLHECTHYVDAFDSLDNAYGWASGLKYWARAHSEESLNNADSIACYIAHFEGLDLDPDGRLWKS
ncbi:M35 family metallo-endopeptidase [Caballeronia catudaia]|uniref:M35 family metallo-endopeptidase n=1 Tax=Caballeronia catudaia TaxID=1777136 RepID=UPI00077219A5|nr:M35 family metallo-endopeptidase [Caballeronia catudaia]